MTPVLTTAGLTLGFGPRVVLHEINVEIPRRGVTVVLGPAGVGKSTLLRTFARRAQERPSFWLNGTIRYEGRDLIGDVDLAEARQRIALFGQKARLYTASVLENVVASSPDRSVSDKQAAALDILRAAGLHSELAGRLAEPVVALPLGLQRRLSMARLAATAATIILADEPTRDLPADEARALAAMIASEGEHRAVVLVTHDLQEARALAQHVILLVAGRQVAEGSASVFFSHPPNEVAQRFLAQGNAWCEDPLELFAPVRGHKREPSGFRWVVPGILGGMGRPGLVNDEDDDLAALHELGVHTLVTLEEHAFPLDRLHRHGLDGDHLPIADMEAPAVDTALAFVRRIEANIANGRPTVYHCKAGLGRTGTLLAAHLIVRGMDALHALEELRTIQPRYVQSSCQEQFLHDLASEHRSGAA